MDVGDMVTSDTGNRNFRCDWEGCRKAFNRKSDLQRHYRIHTNERPFGCTWAGCSQRFIQRSALTVHMRTHTGEKPHGCLHPGCGKKFSDSSSLARHRRIHTGNRPYKCNHDGCTKSFCRKTTMVKHLKRSHHPGRHSPEMEDMISDGGSDSPPSTPNSHVAMPLQPSLGFGPITGQPAYPAGYPQQSTPSFAQTAQHAPYALQPQYGHRHSLPHSQPTPDYHGLSQPQQHPPALGQVFQRTASLPHQLQYHPQVPRQGPERPPLNIPPSPYPTGEHDITSSIPQASPGGFSVTSGHGSPAAQQDFYTHLPPGNNQQRQQQQHEQHQQHQHPQQSWGFDGEVAVVQQYQSPTDVTAIGSLPFSAANNFELWDPDKLDFNETGMTMPSTRINEMS
ncbi:hypothetical protein N657DRAFT_575208 [Parathielavia appendiculata]|uniref:C2H2-type domain-containing protein n=1 Tax=Parathielavia appendiculata TaxID=2587402 RepID=A0AAN6TY36_9PEZI|nr:hypothetical protein N657DRAFT_575208 [Parathielavia appendiculata]